MFGVGEHDPTVRIDAGIIRGHVLSLHPGGGGEIDLIHNNQVRLREDARILAHCTST